MDQQSRIPKSIGGSRPAVEKTAYDLASNESVPFIASRIYAPPAQQMGDSDFDPRYPAKDSQVENLYFPSALPQEQKKRSGVVQVLNWLFTGKME